MIFSDSGTGLVGTRVSFEGMRHLNTIHVDGAGMILCGVPGSRIQPAWPARSAKDRSAVRAGGAAPRLWDKAVDKRCSFCGFEPQDHAVGRVPKPLRSAGEKVAHLHRGKRYRRGQAIVC